MVGEIWRGTEKDDFYEILLFGLILRSGIEEKQNHPLFNFYSSQILKDLEERIQNILSVLIKIFLLSIEI